MASRGDDEHRHLHRVPEPLEKIFEQLDDLARAAGGNAGAEAERVRAVLRDALAAESRGDKQAAVGGIMQAMQALAALASHLDPREANEMATVAAQFSRALTRGDAGEARSAVDTMRDRAGAKIVRED